MKINAIDLKPGNVLEHQGKLWLILKRELVQPGKGGAFAQVEMRDLRGGTKSSERFRTQETVERVRLDEKEMQFLYMEGEIATFMDNDNYEQISVGRDLIGDPADFLRDGMICRTCSSKVIRPTESCWRSSRKARQAAMVQPYSYLLSAPRP